MPIQRPRANELARLLNSVERPIYILDAEGTIVFCNQSLLATIGPAAVDLVGRRCAYHSFADVPSSPGKLPQAFGAQAVATGLCPPPSVWSGKSQTATVSWVEQDGCSRQRLAKFIPLVQDLFISDNTNQSQDRSTGRNDQVMAVIAMVDTEDLSKGSPISARIRGDSLLTETAELHRRVCEYCHAAAERYRVDQLIGDSAAMRLARRRVELAASSRAAVCVVGPPGSGRRHVAETIHYAWQKSLADAEGSNNEEKDQNNLLIPLDCSTLSPDLIRSSLAALASDFQGENSRHSTLLLCEADRLAPEVQAELVAVFSSATFYPRLIATCERPLDELAVKGCFHRDLAALLSTIIIELPPLAHRYGDLPLLAQLFVERENAEGGKQIGGLSPEAIDCLDGYDWPGNVDELALVIAEAHQNAETDMIVPADLPKRIHLAARAATHPRRPTETIVLDDFLAQIERELIQRALTKAKGNKAKVARMLGLSRPRLYRRLIQLGFEQPQEAKKPAGEEKVIFEEAESDEEKA